MGAEASGDDESFESGLLEYPHYTRPALWEDQEIPPILTSGNHKRVDEWRQEQAVKITRKRRSDLWDAFKKRDG